MNDIRPLSGILVLDISQFLAGPSCALRLADLGARVIKIERPVSGEASRRLYISNLGLDGDSMLFHSINRNKQSFAADLRNPTDLESVRRLIAHSDVLIQNFRPGVMERMGLGYEQIRTLNPRIVYGEVTGYGKEGPWHTRPGQDLLAQALSGLAWLSGDESQGPVAMGTSVVDMLAGVHLAQGILACLVRRGITGRGGHVEVSLLESVLDLQFQELTTFFNDGGQPIRRASHGNAHVYLSAPYGIYAASDGYIALAMTSVTRLGELLACAPLCSYTDSNEWFTKRDEIMAILAAHLKTQKVKYWLGILEPADIWCAEVLTWQRLVHQEGFKVLRMTQQVTRSSGGTFVTTRCPIRIDGEILTSAVGSPNVGEHNEEILRDLARDD